MQRSLLFCFLEFITIFCNKNYALNFECAFDE